MTNYRSHIQEIREFIRPSKSYTQQFLETTGNGKPWSISRKTLNRAVAAGDLQPVPPTRKLFNGQAIINWVNSKL